MEGKLEEKCCQTNNEKKTKGFLHGLIYGLIPHTGCIAFILFTILGVTTATAFFKPLLLNRYFFHGLIALSFVFATVSAMIYLRKHGLLSLQGMKKKWKYLSMLYGTSVGINLLLFIVIFPIATNLTLASPTGAVVGDLTEITLKVDIPCPGHAPLISEGLQSIKGVTSVRFRFPDYFDVSYDKRTSKENILDLGVFGIYPAQVTFAPAEEKEITKGCSRCGGCSGACGGLCSI
jgi:hypothetical protein